MLKVFERNPIWIGNPTFSVMGMWMIIVYEILITVNLVLTPFLEPPTCSAPNWIIVEHSVLNCANLVLRARVAYVRFRTLPFSLR